jgi:hypothetical protein
LNIIGRLNSVTKSRKGLKDLPKILVDIYERVLMGVHPLNRSTAHKALQLLAVEEEPELHVIVEAAVVEVEHCLFTKDN